MKLGGRAGLMLFIALGVGLATIELPRAQDQKAVVIDSKQTTTKYGDWALRCMTPVQPSDSNQKSCLLDQSYDPQTEKNLIRITLAPKDKNNQVPLSALVRADVLFQTGFSIVSEQNDPILALPFLWCIASTGCLAWKDLTLEEVNKLRSQTEPVRITYKSASQSDIVIPLSLNGLSNGVDALLKQ
jgi:invasion protein IalB